MPSEQKPQNNLQRKIPDANSWWREHTPVAEGYPEPENQENELLAALVQQSPSLLWVTTTSGTITCHNPAWLNFVGESTVCEDVYMAHIHEDDRDMYRNAVRLARLQQRPFELEYRLLHQRDGYRWLRDTARALLSPDGNLVGHAHTGIDIHDARSAADTQVQRMDELFRPALHDLRGSFGIISGAATILKLVDTSEDRDRALDMIHRNLDRVNEVMNRLLQYPGIAEREAPSGSYPRH